jgi:hypothetical protein
VAASHEAVTMAVGSKLLHQNIPQSTHCSGGNINVVVWTEELVGDVRSR